MKAFYVVYDAWPTLCLCLHRQHFHSLKFIRINIDEFQRNAHFILTFSFDFAIQAIFRDFIQENSVNIR